MKLSKERILVIKRELLHVRKMIAGVKKMQKVTLLESLYAREAELVSFLQEC